MVATLLLLVRREQFSSAAVGRLLSHDDESSVGWYVSTNFTTASLRDAVSLWCSDRAAATLNHGPINMWDTSRVTNMSHLFGAGGELVPWEEDDDDDLSPGVYCYNNSFFDDDVSRWDTSRVTDMSWMFLGASAFNGNISFWNVSLVTNMRGMFARASSFNQSLNYWQGQSLQFALMCTLNALVSCAATFRFHRQHIPILTASL